MKKSKGKFCITVEIILLQEVRLLKSRDYFYWTTYLAILVFLESEYF